MIRTGKLTDEYLESMNVLWTEEVPGFQGRYLSFSGVSFEPKPVQRRGIPIWVGGHSAPALRRAVRFATAWHPSDMSPTDIGERYEKMRWLAALKGTPVPALTNRLYLRPKDFNPQPMGTRQSAFEGTRCSSSWFPTPPT